MRKFEVGKIYGEGALKFLVVKRTNKTVTANVIQHFGKTNEKVTDTKKYKVFDWETREVFHTSNDTIEA